MTLSLGGQRHKVGHDKYKEKSYRSRAKFQNFLKLQITRKLSSQFIILAAATAIAVVVAGRVLPTLIPTNNLLNFDQTIIV